MDIFPQIAHYVLQRQYAQEQSRSLEQEIICLGEEEEPAPGMDNEMEASNIRNLSDMAKFFKAKLSSLPTKQYLDSTLIKIEQKVDDASDSLRRLEKRVDLIESQRILPPSKIPGSKQSTINHLTYVYKERRPFLKAIQSITIWPICGEDKAKLSKNVEDFLRKALCMKECDLNQVIIEDITRVRSVPQSKQHQEVCVLLRDGDT